MMHKEDIQHLLALHLELRDIYRSEGGSIFLKGINSTIYWLSNEDEPENERWLKACSNYKTMAGTKSGFSDFYVARDSFEERVQANVRLDQIRKELWDGMGN